MTFGSIVASRPVHSAKAPLQSGDVAGGLGLRARKVGAREAHLEAEHVKRRELVFREIRGLRLGHHATSLHFADDLSRRGEREHDGDALDRPRPAAR